MDAQSHSMEFEDVWSSLISIVGTVLCGGQVDKTIWNERVSDVYYLCVAQEAQFGKRCYRGLRDFLESFIVDVNQGKISTLSGAELLKEYWRLWQPYWSAVPYLNHLFGGLNTHVIKKYKNTDLNIDCSIFGIDYDDRMLPIGELVLYIWEKGMLEVQKDKLIEALMAEILKDRCGEAVDEMSIRGSISSFVAVGQFKQRDQLRVYQDAFEIPLFRESSQFFSQESRRLVEHCNCSEFMQQVNLRIHLETLLSEKYFHWTTVNKIILDCHQRLIRDNILFLEKHCREKVQRERWQDLHDMYRLLSPMDDGIDTLIEEWEEHLTNIGLAIMQSLHGDNLAAQFVDSVLDFHRQYTERIHTVFLNDPDFIDALDKACLIAINFKRNPKATCRSAELLAKYCDNLLKKTAKGMTEAEMDEKLNHIMILFQYLEDKDIFQQFYSRALAARLIMGQFQSMDIEEAMIHRMKQVCGYEYTSKLHRMFTDITISFDLDSKFNDFLREDEGRKLSHNVSISILQAGAWPISQANLPTFSWPHELEKCVGMFELFYKEQYTGRKLTWMHNLSHVELRFSCSKRTYVMMTELYTMSVLVVFNHVDTSSYTDIRESCQLPNKLLLRHLQLLVDSKILETQGDITESSLFRLNTKFTSKRTKFKILPSLHSDFNVQEVVQTHVAVEADRRMFIQAAIVRIMKHRKELKHSVLMQEIISQAYARFTPRIVTIKKCIEILLEKQYIERSANAPDNYIYIA